MRLELKDLASGKLHAVEDGGAVVGSDPKQATILAPAAGVAAAHARLSVRGGRFVVEDLGSAAGTMVSGVRIKGAVELRAGSTLAVSTYRFQVTRVGAEAVDDLQELLRDIDGGKPAAPTAAKARAPIPSPAGVPAAGGMPPSPVPIPVPAAPTSPGGAAAARARTTPAPASPSPAGRAPSAASAATVGSVPARSVPAPGAAPLDQPSPHPARVPTAGEVPMGELAASFAASLVDAIHRYGKMAAALVLRPEATLASGVVAPQVGSLSAVDLLPWALPPALALAAASALASAVASRSAHFSGVAILGVITLGIVGGLVGALLATLLWHPLLGALVSVLGGASDTRLRANAFVAHGVAVVVLAGALLLGVVVSVIPWAPMATAPIVFAALATVPLLLVWRAWGQRLGLGRVLDVALAVVALLVLVGSVRGVATIAAGPRFSASRVDAELGAAAAHVREIQARAAAARDLPATPDPDAPTARSSLDEFRRRREVIDRSVRTDSSVLERVDRLARLYTRLQHDTDKTERELARRTKRGKRISERQRDTALQARTGPLVDEVYELLTRRR